MATRKFEVWFSMYNEDVDSAVIELDERVISVVDDEWRKVFYNLKTPEKIAEHIAYNLIINKLSLSQLDGWASMPDEYAQVVEWPDLDRWDFQAKEVK